MTIAQFDAPASTTPRRIAASYPRTVEPEARRIVRLIWLTARFVRREPVSVREYQNRFGVALSSFRRDIAALRDAGLSIDADTEARYRLIYFRSDSDA
jgi:predicted DNA-binding transcriptional regulator YafY